MQEKSIDLYSKIVDASQKTRVFTHKFNTGQWPLAFSKSLNLKKDNYLKLEEFLRVISESVDSAGFAYQILNNNIPDILLSNGSLTEQNNTLYYAIQKSSKKFQDKAFKIVT